MCYHLLEEVFFQIIGDIGFVFMWCSRKQQARPKGVGFLRMKLWMLEMAKLKICNNHLARAYTTTQIANTFHQRVVSTIESHFLKQ